VALDNGNFVINGYDVGSGFVRLVNGATGVDVFNISVNELSNKPVTPLSNGNMAVISMNDDIGASNSGSVRVINGANGAVIATISGNDVNDFLGWNGLQALPNGNFVIRSPYDDIGADVDAGSAKLIDGLTGAVLISVNGDISLDHIGQDRVLALSNGNVAILSSEDDVGAIENAGSVNLVNGTTGTLVATISGNDEDDYLGSYNGVALSNGNFVIKSPSDDIGVLANAGSYKLINGLTGAEILSVNGDDSGDSYGAGGDEGVVELSNGNVILQASYDDIGAFAMAGSFILLPSY
jgi:hypothetical protein